MNTLELLSELHRKDIKLWAEGDKLCYSAPPGMLTSALRAKLSQQKEELLRLLRGANVDHSPILPVARDRDLPLSFAQQRLWFLDQLEPGSAAYNMPVVLRLSGPLNATLLEQSINEIIRRHEALRTTFAAVNGQPLQMVTPVLSLALPVLDLRRLPATEREAEAERLTIAEAHHPFDLSQGPLLRAILLQRDEEEYLLLLTMHHIVSDGWSLSVLFRELAVHYEAFCQRKPSPLPELAIQYADFALWQREWLQGEVLEAQLSYWKQQLAGAPPALELPTDRPRPAIQSFQGAQQPLTLSKTLLTQLKDLSRREGVTLFMTLLAAFKALLWRYTGQEDMVVGSPIANRSRAELEDLIGFFVNTLGLRGNLSGNPTFRELLVRVWEVCLGAYAHQDMPFEKLVEELQPQRDASRSPLFQVLFALQNIPTEALELSGVRVSRVVTSRVTAKFDLSLSLFEREEGLTGAFEYNTDLFDPATIERLVGHFQTLLAGIVAHPEQRLSDLPILTERERHQLLVEWNDPITDYPCAECIPQLFEAQVERTPKAVAVIFEDQQLTYEELNRRANQLAHHLQALGVGPETLVGVCMERSIEMIVGLLGILKAGGAYVPLDPAYPQERLAFMMSDTAAPVVLSQQSLLAQLPACPASILCLDSDWEVIAQADETNPTFVSVPENLAYVIYTSGSTGQPKGVAIRHKGLMNLINWHLQAYTVTSSDRATQLAGTAFDASVWEIWPYLAAGASLYLPSEAVRTALPDLIAWLAENKISLTFLPTPLAEAALEAAWPADLSLRVLLTGGDVLRRWSPLNLPFELVNNYGPTENTVVTTWLPLKADLGREGLPPIGRPVSHTQVFILDRHLQPTPVGIAGELYIGGMSLARGYLNRPELTAEKFIPHPFSQEPGARLYRTGDLVRYLPDGKIEFLRRIDHQVKLRGFRIELGEIEAALNRHPLVQETVALMHEDPSGSKSLIAYLVTDEAQTPTAKDLRGFLKQTLPDYMVPAAFIRLDALPLTPNGKVDRHALPQPEWLRPELEESFVPARNPTEEIIAAIWAEVLGLEQVSVADNFFELGGHSLLATQVISRVRHTFQSDLPLRSLFEAPTVAGLAERLGLVRVHSTPSAIPPASRDRPLLFSFAQQRLWFLDQLEPNSPLYNIPSTLRLSGPLDVEALQRAFETIVARHEALRTTFIALEGNLVQVISAPRSVPLPVIDLSPLPEREVEALRLATEEAHCPFDLGADLMLRAILLRLDDQEHILLLTLHHIASDGWSLGVLFRELSALYGAFAAGQPSPLPKLTIQYADFAVWQREWLQDEVLASQLAYWRQQLAGATPALELPTDRPRPVIQTYRGAQQPLALSKSLLVKLKALSQREGVTLFMTLLAAFQVLLQRYTGQADIVVGSPIASRNRTEIEGLIGFFVNTLVLRSDLSSNPTFRELLGRVREVCLGAYAHQDIPFEKLVEELQPERDASRSPLFQVLFVLQNTPREGLELPGVRISRVGTNGTTAKFDLSLSLWEREKGLTGTFEYNTDLFDPATIERMAGHFLTLLEAIVANPKQPVWELPILTEAEQYQLLVAWNDTETDYPCIECIQQLFEAQVERTPEAIAVIFEDQQLAYEELNRRANQLAHHLRTLGVGPDVLVGICLERSLEMVIGLLGILKAGGAYVPLDPTYPEERLAFMLEDTQTPVLLTQQRLLERFPASQAAVICLDGDWEIISRESRQNPPIRVKPENLGYVIYTSGSTGKPKGVALTQQALLNLLAWQLGQTALAEGARTLQFTSLSFDVSFQEIFSTWCSGSTLVMVSEEVRQDVERLARFIADRAVERLFLPFVALQQLAEVIITQPSLSLSLKEVITAGEQLQTSQPITHLFSRLKDCTLHNHYGPSESHVVTAFTLTDTPEQWPTLSPIGRPIANTQIYLLDAWLQPVPVGVQGEVYIAGAGLARGYLNRPDLTAEKFIPNPFSDKPGERLYKTGDLACYLPDGNIKFLGRLDHQVKVRGFRVELGEIEAVLGQHPAVGKVVVVVRGDPSGDKRLVAYVVPKDEGPKTKAKGEGASIVRHSSLVIGELRHYLKEKLPDYMVPAAFVPLEALPLTPNGKVDRRALPAPDASRSNQQGALVPPRNLLELQLVQIWEKLLDIHPIGVSDNFFELGGHSLLAVRLMAQIQKQFGQKLLLATLFQQGATIDHLANILCQSKNGSSGQSPLVGIQPNGSGQPFFCIHPVGGNVLCYVNLTWHLGLEQPFYGLQHPGLYGKGKPFSQVEAMAIHYIEAIRTLQPEGPYLLGGWSLGGVIAFEMARQFRAHGHEVALLALLDPPRPLAPAQAQANGAAMLAHFVQDFGLALDDSTFFSDHFWQLKPKQQLSYILTQAKAANLVTADVDLDQLRRHLQVFMANQQARRSYTPQTYPGRVTLLQAAERPTSDEEPTLGWGKFAAGGVEVYTVPGDHYTLLKEPHVQVLAQHLKTCLEAAEVGMSG